MTQDEAINASYHVIGIDVEELGARNISSRAGCFDTKQFLTKIQLVLTLVCLSAELF
jgi:hypothetical protein